MVRKLFEGFLEDEAQYAACEAYWRELTAGVAESVGQAGEWPPWRSKFDAGGRPMERDLIQMFDGISRKLDRAFTIYQSSGEGEQEVILFAHIINSLPDQPSEHFPRRELVINLVLTEEASQLTQVLLRKWMLPSTTLEEMEAYIDEVLPEEDDESS